MLSFQKLNNIEYGTSFHLFLFPVDKNNDDYVQLQFVVNVHTNTKNRTQTYCV